VSNHGGRKCSSLIVGKGGGFLVHSSELFILTQCPRSPSARRCHCNPFGMMDESRNERLNCTNINLSHRLTGETSLVSGRARPISPAFSSRSSCGSESRRLNLLHSPGIKLFIRRSSGALMLSCVGTKHIGGCPCHSAFQYLSGSRYRGQNPGAVCHRINASVVIISGGLDGFISGDTAG